MGAASVAAAGTAPGQGSPRAPDRLSAPLDATSSDLCSTVRARRAELAAAGKRTVACIEPPSDAKSGPAPGTPSGPTPFASSPAPEQQCVGRQLNVWWYSREWICIIDFGATVNTVNTTTNTTVGQAVYTINHAFGLDAYSGTWSNFTSFYLQSEWGDAATIVDSLNECSGCSGISSGDPMGGQVNAPLQQAVAGRNNLSDNPFPTAIDASIAV